MSPAPERLYQLAFEELLHCTALDVTPPDFQGLAFPTREPAIRPRLGRFVREAQEALPILSPDIAADYLRKHIFTPFDACDQEELWALLLNTKNKVLAESLVYRGTVNSSLVRLPELFKEAVRLNAPSLILSHNHPSGDATPSPEDVQLTRDAIKVGELLQIEVLDHIVLGRDVWVSIKEQLG